MASFPRPLSSPPHTHTWELPLFRASVSRGKFGFQRHKLDFARAAQNVLANNHPSVSECGLLGRTFGLWILNRDWFLQENSFEMTAVSYFTIYTSIIYFTSVLMVAAIQNPYPLEYFFHFPEHKCPLFGGLLYQNLVNLKWKSTIEL